MSHPTRKVIGPHGRLVTRACARRLEEWLWFHELGYGNGEIARKLGCSLDALEWTLYRQLGIPRSGRDVA